MYGALQLGARDRVHQADRVDYTFMWTVLTFGCIRTRSWMLRCRLTATKITFCYQSEKKLCSMHVIGFKKYSGLCWPFTAAKFKGIQFMCKTRTLRNRNAGIQNEMLVKVGTVLKQTVRNRTAEPRHEGLPTFGGLGISYFLFHFFIFFSFQNSADVQSS